MNYGLDYLGGAKFKQVILEEHPSGWGAGFFTKVYEDDSYKRVVWDAYSAINELAATGRAPFMRLAFAWCNDHNFKKSFINKHVREEAKRFKAVFAAYKNIKFYISLVHEHRLNEREWNDLANIVKEELQGISNYELVNTPETRKGFVSKTLLNEYHGADTSPRGGRCAFSHDGVNAVDTNMQEYKKNYSRAEYFFIWNCQMNGRRKADDTTPRKDRKHYPVNKHIDSFIYLHTDPGAYKFPRDCIGKSHGDQSEKNAKPQGKDCKPVFLAELKSNIKPNRITLKTRNGQTVATSTPRASWDDEKNRKQLGWRYYMPEWGYEIAEKARRIQGDPVCDIFADGKKIGTWNPGFRAGKFR